SGEHAVDGSPREGTSQPCARTVTTPRIRRGETIGAMTRSFEDLVREGADADVTGWDFSWLAGRATEQRPAWGYARLLGERLDRARASLDIQTGGGEVLAESVAFPPVAVATESWPPNVAHATRMLHPRGVVVVADPDEPPLPFAD